MNKLITWFKLLFSKSFWKSYINGKILAIDYGFYKSVKEGLPVDKNGLPIPWYTYPAIEYLNNLDLTNLNILEYGSGNSSIYFLNKGSDLVSIEDNKDWFKKIETKTNNNHKYILTEDKHEYVERNSEIKNVDIIVIDGILRKECSVYIVKKINSSETMPTMIIFDNSDWYPNTIEFIDNNLGWIRVDFCGFGPINSYTWTTSIFFNPEKRISRVAEIQSVKGVTNVAD